MADVTEKTRATISITSKGQRIGDIVLRFFHDVAPGHVKNFIDLAKKGEGSLQDVIPPTKYTYLPNTAAC